MQGAQPSSNHSLTLEGRSVATVTGVEDVDCFNEQIVVLRTSLGALTLTGEGLNISKLNLDDGKLIVEGEITAVEYAQRRKSGGIFGQLFGLPCSFPPLVRSMCSCGWPAQAH